MIRAGQIVLGATAIESSPPSEPLAVKAWAKGRTVYLELTGGRIFGFPADRFRILSQASPRHRTPGRKS